MKRGVLIVEDLDSDFEMIQRGFGRLAEPPAILRSNSVQGTISLLEGTQAEERPRLIVLDLRLTDGDGQELLAKFREHPEWNSIPVLVWSAWSDPLAAESCQAQGARGYYRKAAEAKTARETVTHITSHWASLPS